MNRKLIVGIVPYVSDGVEYLPKGYERGIARIGGVPRVISRSTPLDEVEKIIGELDGMLFSGGVDVEPSLYGAEIEPGCGAIDARRDALEVRVFAACMKQKLPMLGICRGCQLINVGMGGTLVQDIPTRFGTVHQMQKNGPSAFEHDVRIVPGTMLYELMSGDIRVDSYHHQCVDRLGNGLVASAYAPEGFIEAFEKPGGDPFIMAVQWHPEMTLDEDMYSMRIFDRFLQAMLEK